MSFLPSRAAAPAARATVTPIPQIQGSGDSSPYVGDRKTVSGVVTGMQRTGTNAGFFLQDPVGDGDPLTSDGIYVRVGGAIKDGWQGTMQLGSRVTASGVVSERGGLTAIEATRASALKVQHGAATEARITPVRLDVPVDEAERAAYLEAREGMLVRMPDALVVGPTNPYGQYIAVDADKHGPRRMGTTPDRTGPIHVNGKLGPRMPLQVGDRVVELKGPLGVSNSRFEVLPTGHYKELHRGANPPLAFGDIDGDDAFTAADRAAIKARSGEAAFGPHDPADLNGDGKISRADLNRFDARAERITGAPTIRIASLNAFNFFDPDDAPAPIDDPVLSGNEYRTKLAKLAGTVRDRLHAPELLALQEVENTRVLDDLLARPELAGLGYRYVLLPTNGRRSIHPALLYRGDGIEVLGTRQLQETADKPERAILDDPADASTRSAAPTSGPLFSREPLVVDLRIDGDGSGDAAPRELTVIVNHLVSKFSPHGVPTDDVRIRQTKFLRDAVDTMRAEHPEREVIVLGDMNDTPDSAAIKHLLGPKRTPTLINATTTLVPENERFSYVYDGKSELIDHITVTPGLLDQVERAGVRHGNADLPTGDPWDPSPTRASDHDSPYIDLRIGAPRT